MKFAYTVNGGETDRSFAARTFGEDRLAFIETTMTNFPGIQNISLSITDKLGNRLTVAAL